jgi:hypothetical protein
MLGSDGKIDAGLELMATQAWWLMAWSQPKLFLRSLDLPFLAHNATV